MKIDTTPDPFEACYPKNMSSHPQLQVFGTLFKSIIFIMVWGLVSLPGSLRAQVVNTGFADSSGGIRLGNEHLVLGAQLDLYRNAGPSKGSQIPDLVSSASLNQWSVNLAFLDLRYRSERLRSRLMPAFGTYMERNYAPAEPRLLEASLGFKPWSRYDLWIDAGLLGSPFTNESPLSRDQPTYTRSFSAEFVPYFLSGVRIGYTWGPKLSTFAYWVNGWQQAVDRVPGQALIAQVEYRPLSKVLINANLFHGREQHSSLRNSITLESITGQRTLLDAYAIVRASSKTLLTSSFYRGWQNENHWTQGNLIVEHSLNNQWSANLRFEILEDLHGVVLPISNAAVSGTMQGYSGGLKFKALDNLFLRSEFRYLQKGRSNSTRETWPYWTLSASISL